MLPKKTKQAAADIPPIGAAAAEAGGELMTIAHNLLHPSKFNRKAFDEVQLAELAASIVNEGVLQNLLARPHPEIAGAFELVAGERRWRAVGLLIKRGAATDTYPLPVRVKPYTDLQVMRLIAIENTQRADMHPVEEGELFLRMIKEGDTTEGIAAAIGKSLRWVQERVQFAKGLAKDVKTAFRENVIGVAQAREIIQAPSDRQDAILKDINRGHLESAKQIRHRVTRDLPPLKTAHFDLKLYTGELRPDETGKEGGPWFKDVAQFEKLQSDAIEATKTKLKESWAWVKVFNYEKGEYFHEYQYTRSKDKAAAGAVIEIGFTGAVKVHAGLIDAKLAGAGSGASKAKTKAKAKGAGDEYGEGAGPQIVQAQMVYARNRKTEALQAGVAADPKAAMIAVITGLLGDHSAVKIRREQVRRDDAVLSPVLRDLFDAWRDTDLGKVLRKPSAAGKGKGDEFDFGDPATERGALRLIGDEYDDAEGDDPEAAADDSPSAAQLAEILTGWKVEKITRLFCEMVAETVGSFVEYRADLGDCAVARQLAAYLKVDMAASWGASATGWADYLALCRKGRLVALVRKMPLGLDPVAAAKMKTGALAEAVLQAITAKGLQKRVPHELQFGTKKAIEAQLAADGQLTEAEQPAKAAAPAKGKGKGKAAAPAKKAAAKAKPKAKAKAKAKKAAPAKKAAAKAKPKAKAIARGGAKLKPVITRGVKVRRQAEARA